MTTDEKSVTWGVLEPDHAVFGGSSQIAELRDVRKALAGASTWGEFWQMLPADRAAEVREMLDEDEPPEDAATFDASAITGEGDWPEWLQQDMLSWIPKDVQERFGSVEASRISGDALVIDASKGEDAAAALEAHGYTCTRDDAAVQEAAGY